MATQTATGDDREQIDKELVAKTLGQVGRKQNPYGPDEAREMRYFNIGFNAHSRDVERGLFIDSENSDELRYGWTNDHRTAWKVEDEGNRVVVSGDVDLEVPDEDTPVEDEQRYVQQWVDILIKELRYDLDNGRTKASIHDEIKFVGAQTLRLRDYDGRKATFEFDLGAGDSDE